MSAQHSRVTSRCDVAHCGREELYHFLPFLLQGMLPLFSIMTLWDLYEAGQTMDFYITDFMSCANYQKRPKFIRYSCIQFAANIFIIVYLDIYDTLK